MDQDTTWYGDRPGQGDIVLDGDPSPPRKGIQQPPLISGPCLLWPNGGMDQDTTWYGGAPRPRRQCVRWGPSSPPPPSTQRGIAGPHFWPTALARIAAGPHFTHNPYYRLGSARLLALVAILPDNCHPSIWYCVSYLVLYLCFLFCIL